MSISDKIRLTQRKSGKVFIELYSNKSQALVNEAEYRSQNRSSAKRFLGKIVATISWIFTAFDSPFSYRLFVISAIGFGFGYGMSVTLLYQPTLIQAVPSGQESNTPKIYAERIQLPRMDKSFLVADDGEYILEQIRSSKLLQLSAHGGLQDSRPAVLTQVGFFPGSTHSLEEVQLFDAIRVVGSNGAEYSYKVTSIVYIKSDELQANIENSADDLIIYIPQNILQTDLLVIKARAVQAAN
ncbi:MAG: hypothetical protein WAU07_02890 [Microgenomates group bacterium]